MPTGYTAPVVDGELTDHKEFLLRVARAFGEFIHQRDEPLNSPPRVPEDREPFAVRALREDKAALDELLSWDEERIVSEHNDYVQKTLSANFESQRRADLVRARLQSMIDRIGAWQANEQAQPIKKYALDQLHETMKYDGTAYISPIEYSASAWYSDKVANLSGMIAGYEIRAAEEMKRVQESRRYAQAILDSIANA